MSDGYGDGQRAGDWTADNVPHSVKFYECTECHGKISQDVWFFSQGKRLLCCECIVLILNSREDYIRDSIEKGGGA